MGKNNTRKEERKTEKAQRGNWNQKKLQKTQEEENGGEEDKKPELRLALSCCC
jgi:hypothetical protein